MYFPCGSVLWEQMRMFEYSPIEKNKRMLFRVIVIWVMQDRGQEEAGGKVRGQNGDITCQPCVHGCEEDKTMVFFLFIYFFYCCHTDWNIDANCLSWFSKQNISDKEKSLTEDTLLEVQSGTVFVASHLYFLFYDNKHNYFYAKNTFKWKSFW